MFKRLLACAAAIMLLLTVLAPAASAEGEAAKAVKLRISGSGYNNFGFLTDGNIDRYYSSGNGCTANLESDTAFSSLYLMFDLEYGEYTIVDNTNGLSYTAGQYSMLHEYVKLEKPTNSVTLQFQNGNVWLSEITAYTEGTLPENVQIWNPPHDGQTDLMLMATHGDDDQLFFAGLLPLYAAERGYNVQVVYMTDHRNMTKERTHEMLNGLWGVGVDAYPVFGPFIDFRLDSLEDTYYQYKQLGTTKEEMQTYVVENLRRFKPKVVVGHDFEGEYGHGMHMVYTDLLVNSLDVITDASKFPQSAEKYGTWEVQKTYIHLYEENPIVIDYDSPLESFDGLTAFQVTQQRGFTCHKSQHKWQQFMGYLYGYNNEIKTAKQIEEDSPCEFGLYRTTVGPDVACNDFMENISSYSEIARQEAERLEQERLEAERLEQDRLDAEQKEKERLEQERLDKIAAQKAEEEARVRRAKQHRAFLKAAIIIGMVAVVVIFVALILSAYTRRQQRRRRRRRPHWENE